MIILYRFHALRFFHTNDTQILITNMKRALLILQTEVIVVTKCQYIDFHSGTDSDILVTTVIKVVQHKHSAAQPIWEKRKL